MKKRFLLAALMALVGTISCLPAQAQATNFFTGYLAIGTGSSTWTEVEPAAAIPVPSVNYARQAITLGPQDSDGNVTNLTGMSFGPAAANWGPITEEALYDAPQGGNLIAWWLISSQPSISAGATYTIPVSGIKLTLADANSQTTNALSQIVRSGTAIGAAYSGANADVVTAGTDILLANGTLVASPYPNNLINTAVVPHAHLRWGVAGDSWVQQASTQVDFQNPVLSSAGISLLDVLCNQCFYFDPANDNFGQGGGYSINILQQMPAIQARHDDVMLVQTGHNAIQAFGTVAGVLIEEQNYPLIIQGLRAAGIEPVSVLEQSINSVQAFTQTNGSDTNPLYNYRMAIMQLNRWKTQYDRINGIREADYMTPTMTPGDVNNSVNSNFTDDGVHLNYAGNFAAQMQSLTDLAAILPSRTVMSPQLLAGDTYDFPFNTLGNLFANGLFTSIGGLGGTNFTGNAPSSLVYNSGSNLQSAKVVTGSISPAPSGYGNAFQIAVSGSTTAASASDENAFFVFNASPNLAAGTIVECSVDAKVSANSPFTQVFTKLVTANGGTTDEQSLGNFWGDVAGVPNGGDPHTPGPTTAWSGRLRIPPTKLNYAGETLTLYLQLDWNDSATGSNGAFTGTAAFSNMTCRQVSPGVQF